MTGVSVRGGTARRARQRTAQLAVLVLLFTLCFVVPGGVRASAAPACGGSSAIGKRLPVLFVHGYNSSAATWDAATLARFCTAQTYSTTFDYGPVANEWVTNPQIGPALAGKILALANASRRDGGPGKVFVVAHSMGGLAVRCAADGRCAGPAAAAPAGQASQVAKDLAAVVTFDTPNLGTFWRAGGTSLVSDGLGGLVSGFCYGGEAVTLGQNGSSEMRSMCDEERVLTTSDAARGFTPGSAASKALPGQPAGVPVFAVAGQAYVHVHLLLATVNLTTGDPGDHDDGDLIVSRGSALAQQHKVGSVGGSTVLPCGTLNIGATFSWSGVSCWHVKETNSAPWLDQVQNQIDAWFSDNPQWADGYTVATSGPYMRSSDYTYVSDIPGQALAASPYVDAAFTSPSGNIQCSMWDSLSFLVCHLNEHSFPDLPDPGCKMTGWITSEIEIEHGDIRQGGCIGGLNYEPYSRVLPYGSTVRTKSYSCHSSTAGVTCADLETRHGFFVSRDVYRPF